MINDIRLTKLITSAIVDNIHSLLIIQQIMAA